VAEFYWVNSRKYHNIHKHNKIEQGENFIDELTVLLLLAVHLVEVVSALPYVFVRLIDVAFDVVDQELLHPNNVHRLPVHRRYLIDGLLDFLVLPGGHFLQHLVLRGFQEVRFAQVYLSLAAVLRGISVRVALLGVGQVDVFELEGCSEQFQLYGN